MTVITYSSAAGRLPKEIQVLEDPSTSGNVPEPLSEIVEPRTMLGPSENPIAESCGVKGQSWTKEKEDQKTGGGAKRGNLQRKRQTWGRGVGRERMKRQGREDLCNLWRRVIRNDSKGSGQSRRKGKDKSQTDVSGTLSAAETEGEIKQWEKMMRKRKSWPVFLWLFLLKKMTEEKVKRERNVMGLRCHHIFLWLTLLFFSLCLKPASSQGNFPQMENIAAFKPISTSPPRSTCGVPERSSYCQSPSSKTDLLTCYQALCIQECPYRSSTPPYAPLLLRAHRGTCVTEDSNYTHLGTRTETGTSSGGSSSMLFRPVPEGCLVSPPSQKLGALGSLTLALWIKPSSPGEMMLLEKNLGERLVFSVTVSEKAVTLRYVQSRSQTTLIVSFRTEGRLALERWTHLVLQRRSVHGWIEFMENYIRSSGSVAASHRHLLIYHCGQLLVNYVPLSCTNKPTFHHLKILRKVI